MAPVKYKCGVCSDIIRDYAVCVTAEYRKDTQLLQIEI